MYIYEFFKMRKVSESKKPRSLRIRVLRVIGNAAGILHIAIR